MPNKTDPGGFNATRRDASTMEQVHSVTGGGGLMLSVREWGKADGPPILLIHGFSQRHLCWGAQVGSTLADDFRLVALDLRGHGMSEKPLEIGAYTDGKLWADDIAAVIDQLEIDGPVLVGWSYGGFIMADYVTHYGQEKIGGLNFVGAAVKMGTDEAVAMMGPGFLENIEDVRQPDLPTQITALRRFIRACTAEPLGDDAFETVLCYNMAVPWQVRLGLTSRELDYDEVLKTLSVPALVTHGTADQLVLPSMAEHIVKTVPGAKPSFYDGVGHVPFVEDIDRFNDELRNLTTRANA